ncbi:MAG: prolyl oligopeptidase family serine peptidase [Longimicrobiales bacterium]|nr:prolyl oligopeptidase family serine peptidase [Longimicrobiales bacterium]
MVIQITTPLKGCVPILVALGTIGCGVGVEHPESRRDPVAQVMHGVEFVDDYTWLEDQDAPETRAWISAQNRFAEEVVGESPLRDGIRRRLRELTDSDDVGLPRRAGAFEYFTMRRRGEEAPILYRRPFVEDAGAPVVEEGYEVVIDPGLIDPTHRTLIAMMSFAREGSLMMYSIRQGGADEFEVRIRDMTTGQDLSDRLPNALYSGVRFDEEGGGFYYVARDRYAGPRIRHHALGSEPGSDQDVWGEGFGPSAFIGMSPVYDGGLRFFTAQHGWARSDLFIQRGDGPVEEIVRDVPAHFQHRFRDGRIYVLTDWNAPNYRLMVADASRPEMDEWKELIPESDQVLESYSFIHGQIFATYLHDVAQRVRIFDMAGRPTGEVNAPENASVTVREGDAETVELTASSHLMPATTWQVDLESGDRVLTDEPELDVDLSPYTVTKLWYESSDSIRAPVYVMHRADIALDGSHATILNGYGGFNSSIRPSFSAARIAWLELGGVYAIATLRGGAEFGERWHKDGMLEKKQHVFDDFIAASEALIDEGFTSPEHLGISGGSNGGLLVGAAMTQRPDLYRAVLCTYPDLDMVRFWAFQDTNNMPALLEYGDARIESQFQAIKEYSPYQAVRDGVEYPAVMLTTGDLDTRVSPLQARKMTARLQAATASERPVILWYDARGGHAAGRGRPMSLGIEDTARELTFMAQELGLGGDAR